MRALLVGFGLIACTGAWAAEESPRTFTIQGRFTDSSGSAPLLDTIALTLGIYNPAGTCLLYEETQTGIDLTTTYGIFSVQLGSVSTDVTKRTANDPGKTMAAIFANKGTQIVANGPNCPGGYTPAPGDGRKLRITYAPSAGAPVTLSPDQALNATPQASVAETLQGYGSNEFLAVTGAATQLSVSKAAIDTTFGLGGVVDATGLHHHDGAYCKLSGTSAQNVGSGGMFGTGTIGTGVAVAPSGIQLQVKASADNVIGAVIQANSATQAANLLEIRNSAGVVITRIDKDGKIYGDGSNLTGVSATDSSKVAKTGDTMTGALNLTIADNTANSANAIATITNNDVTSGQGQGLLIKAGATTSDFPLKVQSRSGADIVAIDGAGNMAVGSGFPAGAFKFLVTGVDAATSLTGAGGGVLLREDTVGSQRLGMGLKSGVSSYAWLQSFDASNDSAKPLVLNGSGGNVGIGTATPASKLEVAGQIKITGGTPGAGKVLTSDASGLATWGVVSGASLSDYTGSACAAGQYVSSIDATGAVTCAVPSSYMAYAGNSNNATVAANTTVYGPATGSFTLVAADSAAGTRSLVSRAGTVQRLFVKASGANGAGKTTTYTVFKNGVAQALACSIVNATTCNDTTGTFNVSAGDEISIQIVTQTGSNAVKHSWSMELAF